MAFQLAEADGGVNCILVNDTISPNAWAPTRALITGGIRAAASLAGGELRYGE
jgi:hypothetical protein